MIGHETIAVTVALRNVWNKDRAEGFFGRNCLWKSLAEMRNGDNRKEARGETLLYPFSFFQL